MAEKNISDLDSRVVQHLLRHRTVTQAEVDAQIAAAEDVSDEAVECEVVFEDNVARARGVQA